MLLSEKIIRDHLHHAYLIEAEREEGISALHALIHGFGIAVKGNPDFHEYIFDVFLLDHAHTLRREQSFRGMEGAKKIFLIAFNTILSEAQNALLKTLEEPTQGTHFFFVTRTSEVLLPTLRSRMQVVRGGSSVISHQSSKNAGEEFFNATVSERMNMIESMTKAKADDKAQAKEAARIFLESLERALYQKISEPKSDESQGSTLNPDSQGRTFADIGITPFARSLEHVLTAKQLLSERSPSLKLILEHLALTVPSISRQPAP